MGRKRPGSGVVAEGFAARGCRRAVPKTSRGSQTPAARTAGRPDCAGSARAGPAARRAAGRSASRAARIPRSAIVISAVIRPVAEAALRFDRTPSPAMETSSDDGRLQICRSRMSCANRSAELAIVPLRREWLPADTLAGASSRCGRCAPPRIGMITSSLFRRYTSGTGALPQAVRACRTAYAMPRFAGAGRAQSEAVLCPPFVVHSGRSP